MSKPQRATIPTSVALAYAIQAYDTNQRVVVRYATDAAPEQVPNKTLMYASHMNRVEPAPELLARAYRVIADLGQRITLNTIKGIKTNDFLASVAELVTRETVSDRDFGILAWAPKLRDDLLSRDDQQERLAQASIGSTYIGQPGHKIRFQFTAISIVYLIRYDTYLHRGTDEHGNLIMFYNRKRITGGNLEARVKEHKTQDGSQLTRVNYVKLK